MPVSEKQLGYAKKYKQKSVKRIPLEVLNAKYDAIKAAADAHGESVNGYIKKAIDARMDGNW